MLLLLFLLLSYVVYVYVGVIAIDIIADDVAIAFVIDVDSNSKCKFKQYCHMPIL